MNEVNLPIIYISTFPPDHCGIGKFTSDLIKAGENRRQNIILTNLTYYGKSHLPNIYYVWKKNDLCYPIQISNAINKLLKKRRAIIHLQHHFFLYGGVLQELELPFLIILLRIQGYKIVTQFHSVIDLNETRLVSGAQEIRMARANTLGNFVHVGLVLFYKLCSSFSNHIIITTKNMKTKLVTQYGISPQKISVIPLGWDQYSTKSGDLMRSSILDGEPIIMFHGMIDPTKGLENLIEAFAKIAPILSQAKLYIVGELSPFLIDGQKYIKNLTNMAHDLAIGNRVIFIGRLEEEQLMPILASADIFVEPYTMKYSLGGSAVLTRIASLGKPIIATRISKFSDELVDNETALLVDVGDVEGIAEEIKKLALNKSLQSKIGNNLRSYSQNHSWQKMYNLLEATVYSKIDEGNF